MQSHQFTQGSATAGGMLEKSPSCDAVLEQFDPPQSESFFVSPHATSAVSVLSSVDSSDGNEGSAGKDGFYAVCHSMVICCEKDMTEYCDVGIDVIKLHVRQLPSSFSTEMINCYFESMGENVEVLSINMTEDDEATVVLSGLTNDGNEGHRCTLHV